MFKHALIAVRMNYAERLLKVQKLLALERLDVLLITHLPNIRYLCGFTGSAGVLAVSSSGASFFTDGRYTEQAHEEVVGAKVVIGHKSALRAASEWLGRRKPIGHRDKLVIGIESDHLTVASRDVLRAGLNGDARLRNTNGAVETLRMVKDDAEIKHIRAAARKGCELFDVALRALRSAKTENDVAAEMEYEARRVGAEAMSFPTIVAAGKRSALPHARASSAALPRNGLVVLDFGVILDGYCSDMTRTVSMGRVSHKTRRMYEAVRSAQQAGLDAVRPGVTAGQVDSAVRTVLKKAGLARYFTHSTGHGVGLEIHEIPRLAAAEKQLLEPGMVITVEPGVYIAGEGGVRIEDLVLVTQRQCEILTNVTRELISV